MMSEQDKCKKWASKILKDDYDKFDIQHMYDSAISLEENKTIMMEEFKKILGDNINDQVEYVKGQMEQIKAEEIKKAEQEAQFWNKKISIPENKEVDEYFLPIKRAVLKIVKGYGNLLIVKGRGGIGKTLNIRNTIISNDAPFIELCGDVTPSYMYRVIYENNDKIIYLKEANKIFQNKDSLNLLKAATETNGGRVLTKSNYSKVQSDLPDSFLCRARFIFDFNEIQNSFKEDLDAIKSRGDWLDFSLSNEDIKNIMLKLCKDDEEKEITEYVIQLSENKPWVRLNLRMQTKAFQTFRFAKDIGKDWKKEIEMDCLEKTRVRSFLYGLIGNSVVRTSDLKKMLLKGEYVNTLRTADNRINEWIYTEELYRHSTEDRNFYVGINEKVIE